MDLFGFKSRAEAKNLKEQLRRRSWAMHLARQNFEQIMNVVTEGTLNTEHLENRLLDIADSGVCALAYPLATPPKDWHESKTSSDRLFTDEGSGR